MIPQDKNDDLVAHAYTLQRKSDELKTKVRTTWRSEQQEASIWFSFDNMGEKQQYDFLQHNYVKGREGVYFCHMPIVRIENNGVISKTCINIIRPVNGNIFSYSCGFLC